MRPFTGKMLDQRKSLAAVLATLVLQTGAPVSLSKA
jgi:hypothetical protein